MEMKTKLLLILISPLLVLVNHSCGQSLSLARHDTAAVRVPNTIPLWMTATMSKRIKGYLTETRLNLQTIKQLATINNKTNKDFVCGLANEPSISGRIIGGTETSSNEFPWQVYLVMETNSGSRLVCGGSLIDSKWVLTAAHCLDQGVVSAEIYLGSQDLDKDFEPNRIVLVSNQFFIHPQYSEWTIESDIALIRLPTEIIFNDYIRPVCLPDSTDPNHVGDPVTLTGWGKISDVPGSTSPVLLKASSVVISIATCQKSFRNIDEKAYICNLGDISGTVCGGDSGGPMNFKNANGTWTVIGIVSFGSNQGCMFGYPDVFTRTKFYLDWIDWHFKRDNNLSTTMTNKPTTKAYRNQALNYFPIYSFFCVIIPIFIPLFLF